MQVDIGPARNTRRIDLNLVRVFVAIFETRSVSLAAARLCVAQPTVSYGLATLRRTLQDPLFARTRQGMIPTTHAKQVYREFTGALSRIDGVVEDSQNFSPGSSRRRFSLAMSDIGELVFLPPLLPGFMREAPHAQLEIVEASVPDLARRLATGAVDAAVGNLPALAGETRSHTLFEEWYVCLLSNHHSTVGKELTPEVFAAAKHVWVATIMSGHNRVEEALQEHGIQRRIALQLPHFAILAKLIATTDLVVVLPSRVAKLLSSYEPLRSLKLPVPIPRFEVRLYWHEQGDQAPANVWLRKVLIESLRGL